MSKTVLIRAATMAAGIALLGGSAFAGELVINTDTSDPAPKAAFQKMIDGFKAENPGVTVKWNIADHEGYKTSIRNFLTAEAPDIAAWYAGNRMAPFVKAGQFADISDLWTKQGLKDSLKAALASATIDGKQWVVPYTTYQWGVYYRKDVFAKVGAAVPKTWAEFLAACAKIKAAGITPITIGSKEPWPTAGWFDYLDLRVNGYDFHMQLTDGKVPYTDPKVKAVFEKWGELVKKDYFLANHTSYTWQEALPQLIQGTAAMYLMGNFLVAPAKNAGLTEDQLGFFPFPEITAGVPRAEDAPVDVLFMPAKAKNKEDALKFLAYVAKPEVQSELNAALGQLPINNKAKAPADTFLKAGFEMLTGASALAQFFDRDAPAQMAKAGMEGFQEFMVKPDRLDAILQRLEKTRQSVYK